LNAIRRPEERFAEWRVVNGGCGSPIAGDKL